MPNSAKDGFESSQSGIERKESGNRSSDSSVEPHAAESPMAPVYTPESAEERRFQDFLRRSDLPPNDSGHRRTSILPEELKGLNWGAAILNVIWGYSMKMPFGMLVGWLILFSIPFVNFVCPLIWLFKGNEWAWRYRRWEAVEDFRQVQKKWAVGSIIALVIIIILICLSYKWYLNLLARIGRAGF
ncbi:MAG: hypothetical protein FJY65_01145 [Calditrichaeota bacterium]|nr:hypothetical protein [Calditrichota bacterium]